MKICTSCYLEFSDSKVVKKLEKILENVLGICQLVSITITEREKNCIYLLILSM